MSSFLCLWNVVSFVWPQSQGLPTYENEAMGIKLIGPEGWYMKKTSPPEENLGVFVIFSRYPLSSKEDDNPQIYLYAKIVTKERNPLEYFDYNIKSSKIMKCNIIKEPILTKINNKECAHYIFETSSLNNNIVVTARHSQYVFMKNNFFYILFYSSKSEYFDKYLNEFEKTVNSFILR
jgi:hypothetical protein